MSKIGVVGLGALNMDYLYRVDRILEDGESIVNEVSSFPGGSAANTIYGLGKLDISTSFFGAVGNDEDGVSLCQDFYWAGVDASYVTIKDHAKTGTVIGITDNLGRRSLYVMPGANDLLASEDIDISVINRADMIHITSFANEAQFNLITELVSRLKPSVKISFSPGAIYASRSIDSLAPILSRTHVLFVNQSELNKITKKDITTGADILLGMGCRTVVVTLGKGTTLTLNHKEVTALAYIKSGDSVSIIEPLKEEKDFETYPTGAGDAFAAGFLYGFIKEKAPEECGRLGNTVARFCIDQPGARQGLPSLPELAQRYQELYQKQL